MHSKQGGKTILTVVLVLLAGLAGSLITAQFVGGSKVSPKPLEVVQDNDELLRLQAAIDAGADERSELIDLVSELDWRLDQLKTEVLALNQQLNNVQSAPIANASDAEQLPTPPDEQRPFDRRPNRAVAPRESIDALVTAGVDEQTAQGIQSRGDQYQLARLELLDQAAREGWTGSEQLEERLLALEEEKVDLRAELGDSRYDRYLFEAGLANRVEVASVIGGSSADQAGLEVGDLIIRYANDRVFQPRELQDATRSGLRGEYVQLELDRGGQSLSADIPRGPLGITLSRSRVEP